MKNENINAETSAEVPSWLQPTINICDLTLADWFAIARANGSPKQWGFFRWTYAATSLLEELSLEEWEIAVEQAGYDKSNGRLYYEAYSKNRLVDQDPS
ncbi:hypothetical protein [Scytonema sp. PCC 10023]|uniref:hypothetical protein n=1 Tax=Scytonema sp. PCC 10023 TaxID=1680591 RepID=UPI0039C6B6E5